MQSLYKELVWEITEEMGGFRVDQFCIIMVHYMRNYVFIVYIFMYILWYF